MVKQWLLRVVWFFNSKIFALNHVFIGKRPGMGCLIGPKNMGPNCGNFFRLWTARERPETDVDCYVGIYALNSILVSRRPKLGMEFGSKKK